MLVDELPDSLFSDIFILISNEMTTHNESKEETRTNFTNR